MNKTIQRIIIDFLILIAVLNGWWIAVLFLGLIAVWFFDLFWEIVLAGIIFDSIFGYSTSFGIWGYAGTIVSVSIFVLILWLKKVLRR